jgi:signal transduction histidine kinase
MKGKGSLELVRIKDQVKISIKDSGSGINKNQHRTIFEPGFTTKKKRMGLGLSLTKRIVEEYHKGSIKVLQSEEKELRCKLYLKRNVKKIR